MGKGSWLLVRCLCWLCVCVSVLCRVLAAALARVRAMCAALDAVLVLARAVAAALVVMWRGGGDGCCYYWHVALISGNDGHRVADAIGTRRMRAKWWWRRVRSTQSTVAEAIRGATHAQHMPRTISSHAGLPPHTVCCRSNVGVGVRGGADQSIDLYGLMR